ncbi:cytochrome c oxidase assembly factor CtaG [Pradoshia sp. D12]|uniref:cytochrome c oxidase assembly factor CtaG n=1 Tax=Bacillaceae TaxID=186817 RepID=UPI00080AE9DF|nr:MULTISPECIES: cytochrome c oxidase assembly factor CtaG [Bacillaceae]OCA89740.1 cytochrome c oxidase assembly factor CtaG [Bacillus sp. FJAT-27986]QFK70864.1 cytochrome c oxidase assembly factor CtaG [Pradoshia sp. D12]TPF72656.1 cytochrome c oxidase assembly factor CtaG [Bacillus sp. D12]
MELDIFGFRALWSPYLFLVTLLIIAFYFYITYFKAGDQFKKKEAVYFSIAMILLYMIKGSPIDLLGHLSFTVHMVQMAFLFLVIPPFFLLGLPDWLLKKFVFKKWFLMITQPLITLIFFNGLFSFYHVPSIFDIVKVNMLLHGLFTVVLFISSLFMWWHLVNKIEESQRLSGLKKIGYIFANGILITPACALIIFSKDPMYATYADPAVWMEAMKLCVPAGTLSTLDLSSPQMFINMPAVEDQQTGGVIMKIIQEIVYGIILATTFFTWFKEDTKHADAETKRFMEANPHLGN